uniref:hypothetical protein n=1 Tax=Pelistega indica TaxID=1414851 RepID=UPI0004CF4FC2
MPTNSLTQQPTQDREYKRSYNMQLLAYTTASRSPSPWRYLPDDNVTSMINYATVPGDAPVFGWLWVNTAVFDDPNDYPAAPVIDIVKLHIRNF